MKIHYPLAIAVILVLILGYFMISPRIADQGISSNIDNLQSIEEKSPKDYIEKLESIINSQNDPYVRERAVFTLTQIAISNHETDKVIPILKRIATEESNTEVRTAAYANSDLIQSLSPPPSRGSLNLTIEGTVRKGSTVRIIATVSSSAPPSRSVVGIHKIPDAFELQSDVVYYPSLKPNITENVEFTGILNKTGEFSIPISLLLSFDRIESESIDKWIFFTVNETDGGYFIKEE